jgi:hypothetical protein
MVVKRVKIRANIKSRDVFLGVITIIGVMMEGENIIIYKWGINTSG